MKLEDQVCSLDLAKRLKELGVKQESAFFWYDIENKADGSFSSHVRAGDSFVGWGGVVHHAVAAAFTVAELLALIGEPRIVPAEGGADELAAELIRMYENGGHN